MPVILSRPAVEEVYGRAAEAAWTIPTFCTENQTTTEAILSACQDKAEEVGRPVPITIAATCNLPHRPQLVNYAANRSWRTGQRLFLGDCAALAPDYPDVEILTHFDHGQPELDRAALTGDLSGYSSVMFDASEFPWQENLRQTADFVTARGEEFVIEGACDEISAADGEQRNDLTTPERALEFLDSTGVDLMVVNLGTEHRSKSAKARYRPDVARAIRAATGPRLVVHGASSAPRHDLETAFADGVCKVNIWTTLERDTSPLLFAAMLEHAAEVAGESACARLVERGLLGSSAQAEGAADLEFCTTTWRQSVVFEAMKAIVAEYLDMWYVVEGRS